MDHDEIDDRDEIAQEAARLFTRGDVTDLATALRRAADGRPGRAPGLGRVRQHVKAMTEASVGAEAYDRFLRATDEALLAVVELLETLPNTRVLVVGRAASGLFDGGATAHLRAHTDEPIGAIAAALVEHGCEEPDFETGETTSGRVDRLRFEDEGIEFTLTRLPSGLRGVKPDRNLFSGRRIKVLTARQLRSRVEAPQSP